MVRKKNSIQWIGVSGFIKKKKTSTCSNDKKKWIGVSGFIKKKTPQLVQMTKKNE